MHCAKKRRRLRMAALRNLETHSPTLKVVVVFCVRASFLTHPAPPRHPSQTDANTVHPEQDSVQDVFAHIGLFFFHFRFHNPSFHKGRTWNVVSCFPFKNPLWWPACHGLDFFLKKAPEMTENMQLFLPVRVRSKYFCTRRWEARNWC